MQNSVGSKEVFRLREIEASSKLDGGQSLASITDEDDESRGAAESDSEEESREDELQPRKKRMRM